MGAVTQMTHGAHRLNDRHLGEALTKTLDEWAPSLKERLRAHTLTDERPLGELVAVAHYSTRYSAIFVTRKAVDIGRTVGEEQVA